jgi:hypothetical protein
MCAASSNVITTANVAIKILIHQIFTLPDYKYNLFLYCDI